jgi:predicted nicotinamide N-methyase
VRVAEGLVSQSVELPGGELRILQPEEAADLPDDGPVEWAPVAPYWAVLWRSGVALARELEGVELEGGRSSARARRALAGRRVVELGCGLAVPSIAAARAGASVLATDVSTEALALAKRNARANGVRIETAALDWADPGAVAARAPSVELLAGRDRFDLVLAADVLYERPAVAALLDLLPRLAREAWLADPGRSAAGAFLEQASRRWPVDTRVRGVVRIHRLRFSSPP